MALNDHSVLVDLFGNGIGKVFVDGNDISNHVLDVKIESAPGKETRVTFSTRPEKVSAHFQNAEVYLVEKEREELGKRTEVFNIKDRIYVAILVTNFATLLVQLLLLLKLARQ